MKNPREPGSHEQGAVARFLMSTLLLGGAIAVAALAVLSFRGQRQPDSLTFDDEVAAAPSVDEPNAPPFLTDDLAVSRADGADLTLDVLANDRDPDGSTLTLVDARVQVGDGSVVISGAGSSIVFRPERASSGPWTISYTAADEQGLAATASVSVSDGNRAPLPAPDFITVLADEAVEIDPLVNDEDEVAPLTIVRAATDVGPLEIIDGRRIGFLAPHEVGTIEIQYTIEDVTGKDAASTVTVTVVPWDPVAADDAIELVEDTEVVIDVLANDGPELADLDPTTLIVLDATLGDATASSGAVRFVPTPDATGTALITYQVCTTHRACDMATVQVEILPVNDAPSFDLRGDIEVEANAGPQSSTWATNISAGPRESQPVLFSVTTDRPDLFADAPTFSPQGILEFEPNPARNGWATLTVQLFDSEGATAVRTFRIRIIESAPDPEIED